MRQSLPGGAALTRVVLSLDSALREPGDERTLVLEVALDDAARPAFDYSFELPSVSPAELVLDPGYRYPNHPAPGMPRPDAATPTAAPTDPAVLARIQTLVDEFTALYAQVTGRAPAFGPTCDEQEIAEAEQRMGLRLPDEVRALYRVVGTDGEGSGLLGNYALLPLAEVVSGYVHGEPGCWNWTDELFQVERVVFETSVPGATRRVSRSDWRVVIGSDFAGNECAVDLDPGPTGHSGQLLEWGRDFSGPAQVVAESVAALVTTVVQTVRTALRDGELDYQDGDDHIGVEIPGRTAPDPVVSWRVGTQELTQLVTGVVAPAAVQQVYLHDADRLDLRALVAFPNVRELNINRTGEVRIWLPPMLEALSIDAQQADLSALAGHPTLWDLTVRGMGVRVDQVAALPALQRLDLSAAEVEDIETLAELDLRVLVLNADQWRALRATGRLPRGLAGVQLASPAKLTDALDWARWLKSSTDRT